MEERNKWRQQMHRKKSKSHNIKNNWFKWIAVVFAADHEADKPLMSHCWGKPSQLATNGAGCENSQCYLSKDDECNLSMPWKVMTYLWKVVVQFKSPQKKQTTYFWQSISCCIVGWWKNEKYWSKRDWISYRGVSRSGKRLGNAFRSACGTYLCPKTSKKRSPLLFFKFSCSFVVFPFGFGSFVSETSGERHP